MNKPLQIGITGGIGSGKTTVAMLFQALEIPVYLADHRAKQLLLEDQALQNKVSAAFGTPILLNGELDRKKMGQLLFGNESLKKEVEALIHPAVAQDFGTWTAAQKAPFVLKEAAILFETGSYRDLDATILVVAPAELRIQRVLSRDPYLSRDAILARMEQQWTDDKKIPLANYQVINDSQTFLLPQILACHETIIHSATA